MVDLTSKVQASSTQTTRGVRGAKKQRRDATREEAVMVEQSGAGGIASRMRERRQKGD